MFLTPFLTDNYHVILLFTLVNLFIKRNLLYSSFYCYCNFCFLLDIVAQDVGCCQNSVNKTPPFRLSFFRMWLQTITSFQKISRNWLYLLFFILSRTLICQDLREKWYFEIEVFPKQLFSQETVRHTQECVGCELGMRICAYFFEVGTIFDRDHNKTIELACFFDTNYSNPNWDFFRLMFIFL